MTKVILKISGMHCSSCSLRIDGDLEETEGVQTSETNFTKGESKVEYDETKVSLDQLKKVIEAAGYTVTA